MFETIPEVFRAKLDAALSKPLLLSPGSFELVRSAGAFRAAAGSPFGTQTPSGYLLQDRVAVIDIEGPLSQRAWSCFGMLCEGYDSIQRRVFSALQDERVGAIVLKIDSPGGEVAGCFDAVRAMRQASLKAGKPMVAYADELAASAAYAIACACEKIVVPSTGVLGSVGVITKMMSYSRQLTENGVDVAVVTSGAEKADGNQLAPLDPEAVARTKAMVDDIAKIFAEEVSLARGMSIEDVLALEAGLRTGAKAVEAKLADSVGTLESAIELARSLIPASSVANTQPSTSSRADTETQRKGETKMESVILALGLKPGAAEDEVANAARAKVAALGAVRELTGTKTDAEALGVIDGWKAEARKGSEALQELAAYKAEERKTLLDAAVNDGRMSPEERRLFDTDKFYSSMPIESLKTSLSVRTAKVPMAHVAAEAPAGSSVVALTDEERAVAKQMGLTEAQMLASKRATIEGKKAV